MFLVRSRSNMKIKTHFTAAVVVSMLAVASFSTAYAADQKVALPKPKISKPEAKKTALARVPNGKIKDSELEQENCKLVWSFDIATKGSKDITEVQVDATTGKIVSVAKETPAEQKKEKVEDAKEKKEKHAH